MPNGQLWVVNGRILRRVSDFSTEQAITECRQPCDKNRRKRFPEYLSIQN